MRELASILMSLATVAASYAAWARATGLPRQPTQQQRSALAGMVVLALIATLSLWPRTDGLAMALLSSVFALSASSTAFILLEPLFPRVLWRLALASPILSGLLAALSFLC
jgi:hypothetical protein